MDKKKKAKLAMDLGFVGTKSAASPFKKTAKSAASPFKKTVKTSGKEAMTKQTKKVPATMPFVTKTYLADPANSPKKYDYSKSKKENLKRIMPSAKDGALKKKKKSSYMDAILGN